MSTRELIIEGARQNNLKNISLCLPHDKLIVITGLSGSGKSSLAFDTIFAEGQWRFLESLSTYARVFIEKLNRPEVDKINNIRPSIALQQHNPVKGSRSTVGTLTELYDYLRVVYAKVATPFCPQCNKEVRRWDVMGLSDYLIDRHEGQRAMVLFETSEPAKALLMRGYERFFKAGDIGYLSEEPLEEEVKRLIVVDRLVIEKDERLFDALRQAWREGKERLRVLIFPKSSDARGDLKEIVFSSSHNCDDCQVTIPEASPLMFSFNHPLGACKRCKGFGNILVYDEDAIVPNKRLSIMRGAFSLLESPTLSWWKGQLLKGALENGIDVNAPYQELSKEQKELLFNGNNSFYGIKDLLEDLESQRYKVHIRILLSRFKKAQTCPDCKGKRLSSHALSYKLGGLDISELCEMPVQRLLGWFDSLRLSPMQEETVKEALRQIKMKLSFLNRVGLGYLSLSRQSKTLSGGEYQRLNLANQLSSQLTGTLYVLDEPTIGLHPRDTNRIIGILKELVSLGNTVIVVEHDRDVIASSDYVVEMGPGGGDAGGEVVFSGYYENFIHTDTLTARCLRENLKPKLTTTRDRSMSKRRFIVLKGASGNNLKGITINIPIEELTVVTGVSGSGKSSLIVETLYPILARHFRVENLEALPYGSIDGLSLVKGVRLIDQSPLGKTPRSNTATYVNVFEPIRRIFSQQPEARALGYKSSFFSFNLAGGRCEACKGEGFQRIEMYFFEDIYVRCEECGGKRYNQKALRIKYKGKDISQVLEMTVDEATLFFREHPEVTSILNLLQDVGLNYLKLGQPLNTLSGGESQRLKICGELLNLRDTKKKKKRGVVYILDEPTVGLHYYDVIKLMNVLFMLLQQGSTVIVIEHNLDVIALADHLIDLGPEGGDAGGKVVFEGHPLDIVNCQESLTGMHLRQKLKNL